MNDKSESTERASNWNVGPPLASFEGSARPFNDSSPIPENQSSSEPTTLKDTSPVPSDGERFVVHDDIHKKQAIDLSRLSRDNSAPIPIDQLVNEVNENISTKKGSELQYQDHPARLSTRDAVNLHSVAPNSQEQNDLESPSRGISNTEPAVPEEHDIVIPVAFLVDVPPAEVAEIPSATVVIPDKWSLTIAGRKIHMCILVFVIAVIISTVALATGLTLKASRDKQAETEALALKKLASKEQIKIDIERNVLRRNLSFSSMPANDNRRLALDWLLNKDPMKLDASSPNLYQRFILALMAFDFGSAFDWISDVGECEWEGVSCLDGKVRRLYLNEQNLTGTLPPEISGLGFLHVLTLQGNGLHGTIPDELGGLNDLQFLDFGSNYFSGGFPASLTKGLIDIRINNNELSGTFPEAVRGMKRLKHLDIGSHAIFFFSGGINQFTGTLPSYLFDLPELIHLDVSGNKFEGTFPTEIIQLSSLRRLDINRNQFGSTLPSEIGGVTGLTYLSVYMNRLRGTIPKEVGNLHALTFLDASANALNGSLPSELGMLTFLEQLWLNSNKLTGSIPPGIGNLKALTVLDISKNQLNGTTPATLGNLAALTNLLLYDNEISGTLPPEVGQLKNLAEFIIYGNEMTGTIPSELANLDALKVLDISSNQFTGVLPSEIEQLISLSDFCAKNNSFTSEIMPDIETC